ncbi:hypothetical protein ACFWGN_03180 [Oerskovia sp. NPDC060338]|uniref:tRNA ligase subunit PheS family protein n=1 Tax=Oerskovia sp. NPDC060338 TaxID=3347100 RepID=UPI00364BB138
MLTANDGQTDEPFGLDVLRGDLAPRLTTRHPITTLASQVTAFFASLGFRTHPTPEVEDVLHSFDLLSVPEGHPTRSPAHTFYLEDGRVLRSHTTSSVMRVLRQGRGRTERRVLVGGPCYRNTTPTPRFVTQFHQMEVAAVGPDIVLTDATGMALGLLDDVLGQGHGATLRFRTLPYVSPGFSVDAPCTPCEQAGCALCGGRGFLEVMSGGALTPAVMAAAEVPSGSRAISLAISLERLLAIRHHVADIRPFLSTDLRVLAQNG